MGHEKRQVPYRGEIDLFGLIGEMWERRRLIGGVALSVAAIAAFYAFLATPHYRTVSVLHPPALKELAEINSSGVYTLKPNDVLVRLGVAVSSYENRLNFARKNEQQLAFLGDVGSFFDQKLERFITEAFEVERPDLRKEQVLSPFIRLILTYPDELDGVGFTNSFVQFAIDQERQRIKGDFEAVVANRLAVLDRKINAYRASYDAEKNSRIAKLLEKDDLKEAKLKDELSALRQLLRDRRNNRIALLEENIAIARSLKIYKPTTPTALGDADKHLQGRVIRTEVNSRPVPLYFRGVQVLEAERSALLKRESDDFTSPRVGEIQKALRLLEVNRQVEVLKSRTDEDLFLKKLAASREEEARLRALSIDFSSLTLVKIDKVASTPLKAIGPGKFLIVMLGFLLGGLLGAIAALVQFLMLDRKQESPITVLPVEHGHSGDIQAIA